MTTRAARIWNGTAWEDLAAPVGVAPVSYQSTEPPSPQTGDIWIDSSTNTASSGIPVNYQAAAPVNPSIGTIWIESDIDVPSVGQNLSYRWRRIAGGGETSLSGNDSFGLPLTYTPGYEQFFLNGMLLYRDSDYTASTGTTITGFPALTAGDVVEVLTIKAEPVADTNTQAQARGLFISKTPTVVSFNSSTTWTVPSNVSLIDVLVVAGGGGGGLDVGGGGGAGGLIYKENYAVTPGASVTVTIGAGGAQSNNGGNSVFGALTAIGGGYGGNYAGGNGNSGGSGGGGTGYSGPGFAGAGTAGQGYAGGPQNYGAATAQLTGSGGGGAGGPGQPGVYSASGFTEGGPGFACSITGTMVVYAKGGRGGGDNWTGMQDGAANTGNGGDGAGNPNTGKTGGSGIVIVRYSI
jgi:hypothetical protein